MPSSYTNVVLQKPDYLATGSWTPQDDRKPLSDLVYPGVVGSGDFLVSFVSGLTVSVAAGVAFIKGGNVADQGTYREYDPTSHNISVASGGANPRLDQIILRILDQDHDTSRSYQAVLEVIPGTPTAGATLANRTGAANLDTLLNGSKSYLLLADVLVPAGAGSISGSAIGDRRMRYLPKGNEHLARVTRTTTLAVTATTEATAQVIMTAPDVFCDGVSEYCVEFSAPSWNVGNDGDAGLISLFDNGAAVCRLGDNRNSTRTPFYAKHFIVPTFGIHSFSARVFHNPAGGTVFSGDGTSGNLVPSRLRITRISG